MRIFPRRTHLERYTLLRITGELMTGQVIPVGRFYTRSLICQTEHHELLLDGFPITGSLQDMFAG